MIRQLTAKSLRMRNIHIPDHIPDRAVIDPNHVNAKIGLHYGIGDIVPTQYIKDVCVDLEFFTWEPYRRPTNARPLVSRAKREGLYCGWHAGSVTCMITEETVSWGAKHCRQGFNQHAVPLRQLKDYNYVATTAEEAEAIFHRILAYDKIIAKGTS